MKNSIIVEGFDNMGKSTLIKELANRLNMPIYTAGPPPKDLKEMVVRFQEQLDCCKEGYLLDRVTAISEPCYNKDTPYHNVFYGVREMMAKDCIIIYCSTTWDDSSHVVKDHDTDEHLRFIEENREAICGRYEDMMKECSSLFTMLPFNWRKHSVDTVISYVLRLVEQRASDQS